MDLLDFEGQQLYFNEPCDNQAEQLLQAAAGEYSNPERAELLLLKANLFAPENLSVLVALYRFYYYRHRLEYALRVAHRALRVSGKRLGFPVDFEYLTLEHVGAGALQSMTEVRFYLLALKAAGFVNLRLRRIEEGYRMLCKVVELDAKDRLGAGALLDLIKSVKDVGDSEVQLATA